MEKRIKKITITFPENLNFLEGDIGDIIEILLKTTKQTNSKVIRGSVEVIEIDFLEFLKVAAEKYGARVDIV